MAYVPQNMGSSNCNNTNKYSTFYIITKKIINNQIFNSIELVLALIIAIFANSWHIEHLKKSGYQLDIIAAKNSEEAKLKFYQQHYK